MSYWKEILGLGTLLFILGATLIGAVWYEINFYRECTQKGGATVRGIFLPACVAGVN